MKIVKAILIVLLFPLLNCSLYAAEGDLVEGNTIIPIEKRDVRLVSEEVRVSSGAKIDSSFILENLSDKPIKMKIGFPFRSSGPEDFKAWIQGNPVKVNSRLMGGKDEIAIKDKDSGFKYEMFYWDISFLANERKLIMVNYTAQWGSGLRGDTAEYFIHITNTGALWSGKIEKADFYINLDEFAQELLNKNEFNFKLYAQPKGFKRIGNQLEWHYLNWEPSGNISIAITEEKPEILENFLNIVKHSEDIIVSINDQTINQENILKHISQYFENKNYQGGQRLYAIQDVETWKSQIKTTLDEEKRICAKALRNEIYARHGRLFTTPEMKQIFESVRWYKPRQDFKESELNEIEKKNVEFIFEYEKKMGWQ